MICASAGVRGSLTWRKSEGAGIVVVSRERGMSELKVENELVHEGRRDYECAACARAWRFCKGHDEE